MAFTFKATVGKKFASFDEDTDINTAVTDAAREIFGTERHRKRPWVTKDVLNLCDERRDMKMKRYKAEGAKEIWEANKRIQMA